MSGGGGTTQVTNTSSAPWANQQPYLEWGFDRANNNFFENINGNRAQYYPGETYMPASAQTTAGNNALYNRGQKGSAAETAVGNAATSLTSRGASGMPGYGTLAQTANGGMIGRNPEFQGMVDRSISAARPSIDSAFAASGRMGSGNHARAFADSANNIAGNLAYQDYGQERQNQLSAAGQLGSMDLAARGLGGQLTAQDSAADYNNINGMLQAGLNREGYADKALTDDINRFNFNAGTHDRELEKYMRLVQGNYGQQGTSAQPVYGNSGLSQALGGASSLGGLAMGAGSLITALSDERSKEDIKPVGSLDNGLTVYSYRYKGDDVPQIGLLAQEVAQVRPEAVGVRQSGLLGVNYDLASR